MLTVKTVDELHFNVTTPCGTGSIGMRHTEDVRIVLDRAMDHVSGCAACSYGHGSDARPVSVSQPAGSGEIIGR